MIRALSLISMGMAKSTRSYIITRTGRYNPSQSLGRMISEDTTLAADWVADWVGKWNLERWIRLRPARREVASGKPDLLVDNHDWFGMISEGFSIELQKMYGRWTPNYHYGRNW